MKATLDNKCCERFELLSLLPTGRNERALLSGDIADALHGKREQYVLRRVFDYHSAEAHLARHHGINDPKPLLMTTPDTGDMGYIITSGGRFYWGDLMIDHIAEITKPRTWPEILRVLTTKGAKCLRKKFVQRVVVDEEPWEEEMSEGQGPSVPSSTDVPATSEK
ncbi:hypothetical protein IFM61606_09566 [Aspergillus udagawae]|nr:hypothetical protein IFM61606_09566 [Aspergillus udagawae]